MIGYIVLLSLTAFFAYTVGSLGTLRLAGRFVFRQNLLRLGKGNVWLSNFRRIYGVGGFIKLLLVEAVKVLLPILVGGLLLSLKGKGEVGRAFAGFCVMMGRLWPVFNRYQGCRGCVALALIGLVVEPSVGLTAAGVCAATVWFSRYISFGAFLAAAITVITSALVVDNSLAMYLMIATAALVLVRQLPSLRRILRGQEERLSFQTDLTYKLDSKF